MRRTYALPHCLVSTDPKTVARVCSAGTERYKGLARHAPPLDCIDGRSASEAQWWAVFEATRTVER